MANEHVEGAAKKAGGFLTEFKEFALKGNVMDMAIGVIIGGAFQSIVTALTSSFINPLIGVITGGAEKDPETGQIIVSAGTFTVAGVEFTYGAFISAVVNFLIIAFILFCLVKAVNKAMSMGKKKEEEPAAPPEPTKEELLLTEIRDLLKENAALRTELEKKE
ncbi:MAG: large-conductance mechanosensitive channel protein MscL [Oscillospiraceae bacterium]|nr:large-conductance mechanosensitive channel protein MscL [Oscillospiraceae bacterium]